MLSNNFPLPLNAG